MNKKLWPLPLLILLLHSSLSSQTTEKSADDELSPVVAEQRNPSWLLLEQGKVLYQQRDYGEALRKFLLAKRSSPYAPEANYLISRIFDVDNHLRLAVTQLQEALDQKDFFTIKMIYTNFIWFWPIFITASKNSLSMKQLY